MVEVTGPPGQLSGDLPRDPASEDRHEGCGADGTSCIGKGVLRAVARGAGRRAQGAGRRAQAQPCLPLRGPAWRGCMGRRLWSLIPMVC
jgi:hypothetical protein